MTESKDNIIPESWLDDLPKESRVEGYNPEEMIQCSKCARSNPPNRLDCMYCGVDLEFSAEQSGNLRPKLRKAENWKNAHNVIFLRRDADLENKDLREAAKMVRIEPGDLEKMLDLESPIPLARSDQETEIGIVVRRLDELGLKTVVFEDSVFELSSRPKRLRRLEFIDGSIEITFFNDGTVRKIDRSAISQIVVGVLFEHRVESTEKQKRKKDEKTILETAETSEDELVIDIFLKDDPIGFRISANGFDFSTLGQEKSMFVGQNMKTLIAKLRSFSPAARFDESYLSIRGYLSNIWDVEEQTDSKGLKRGGFGGYNRELVTTSNNTEQFTRYSRLLWHLK
ncbi:MAG: hypothetical protein KDB79_08225 [Acidobacteria bacterium]|nr:hypothetical protein [Acidobacteriota bacterium]